MPDRDVCTAEQAAMITLHQRLHKMNAKKMNTKTKRPQAESPVALIDKRTWQSRITGKLRLSHDRMILFQASAYIKTRNKKVTEPRL
jgi:hypothetical protein